MRRMSRIMATVVLTAGAAVLADPVPAGSGIPDDRKIGGFALGVQAWSFNQYTAFEAIEKTAEAGAKVIEFYPGQRLRPADDKAKLDHNMSDEDISLLKKKLAEHDITAVNYGVVWLGNDEAGSRKVFEFAKKMGIPCVTSEPAADSFDLLEKLVNEYDIRLAIHNHPRKKNKPGYKYWDPEYVLSVVKDRDRRIGACADSGHWVRSGVNPLKALKLLRGRIMSLHLKDLSSDHHDVPYGAGICDIAALLKELDRQEFDGNISIEYEYNWTKSVPEIAQCIGFVRGWATED